LGLQALHRSHWRIREIPGCHAVCFYQASHRAALQGIGYVAARVCGSTGPGDEAVTRSHSAAVAQQRTGDTGPQPS
jgi:hypothetical protein